MNNWFIASLILMVGTQVVDGIVGDVSGLRGDVSGIFGDATGIQGDLDDCELTDEERKRGVDIEALIEKGGKQ